MQQSRAFKKNHLLSKSTNMPRRSSLFGSIKAQRNLLQNEERTHMGLPEIANEPAEKNKHAIATNSTSTSTTSSTSLVVVV